MTAPITDWPRFAALTRGMIGRLREGAGVEREEVAVMLKTLLDEVERLRGDV